MNCHSASDPGPLTGGGNIALVGHPNVGKSVVFQFLTGQHVAISNYPGTTVEVARGRVKQQPDLTLVDTPGIVTFPPHSEDEQVTARVLFDGTLKGMLQVGDAKNLRRTLLLTVQLAEMGLPLALALNMMDEATSRGMAIDAPSLERMLGLPVVPTVATRGLGITDLLAQLGSTQAPDLWIDYPPAIEAAIKNVNAALTGSCGEGCACSKNIDLPISARSLALLWLGGDEISQLWLSSHLEAEAYDQLVQTRQSVQGELSASPAAVIQQARLGFVERLTSSATLKNGEGWKSFSQQLGRLTTHSFWGLLILAVVLYGLYWFVGVFGAGTLVGLLENNLFGEIINPWLTGWVTRIMPFPWMADFLVGPYGLWTMGITYAVALILPIVTTFFLAFGLLEDSGYLPRLAALSNRLFQMIGLNGKAVLPMVLGLGCVTMATVTTRVLESKRERVLVTLLLALAVPCSAQLGVVMGMLAAISFGAASIWAGVVLLVLLTVGWLAARLMPGERSTLLVEMPPMRLPQASNVTIKTLARLEWYTKEVVPLFLVGAALMFVLDKTGLLTVITRLGEPLVTGWLGLPAQASASFLMGFLRRDFGATGLFDMQVHGLLSPVQVVVAMVTITLFIPCIASVMMIAKERGWRTAVGMSVMIFPLALLIGGLLNRLLLVLKVTL